MPSLADLVGDRATLPIPFGAETITVVYRPTSYTMSLAERLGEVRVAEFIEQLVIEWDVTTEGEPVPLVAATLDDLVHPAVLRAVTQAIIADAGTDPGKARGGANNSRSRSSTARARGSVKSPTNTP